MLLRLPQEDFLQALGLEPGQKYQQYGGPNFADCIGIAQGSIERFRDMTLLFQTWIVFWMLNATDGHAKNFSIGMKTDGYVMTPLNHILSAAPHEASGNLSLKDIRMAMSVGQKRHYRMDQIQPRHFEKSAHCAGIPEHTRQTAYVILVNKGAGVLEQVGDALPADSPDRVATPIIECV